MSSPKRKSTRVLALLGEPALAVGVIGNHPELIAAAEEGDTEAFLAAVEMIRADTEDLATSSSEVGPQVCAAG